MKKATRTNLAFLLVIGTFLLGSCAAIEKGGDILAEAGKISESDKESIVKTTRALRSSFGEITGEEEYYIGRAVSALILSKYPVYNNKALTDYINSVGTAVVFYSDRPETYAGYHFLILDTEEVNALSAPGGFIFVTKGLLRRCRDEEMLGCILAHEVGHVTAKHGLQSIKKSRLIDAFKIIGEETVQRYGSEKLAKLTDVFEGALGDIAEKLIERGYDRKYEYEADRLSIKIAAQTGYSPQGLINFLQTMVDDSAQGKGEGWFKTHPSASDRMQRAKKEIATLKSIPYRKPSRTKRFQQAIKNLQ